MKKKYTRFPISSRGYNVDAVDSFLALENAKNDERILEERNRIRDLKEENDTLKARVAELEGREEQIKKALVTATENAEKLSIDVKTRYRAELERLRLFRAKWINAYESMKERYHFDKDALNMESVAVSCEIELKNFLSKDFSLNVGDCEDKMEEYFRQEVERLTNIQVASQGISNKQEFIDKLNELASKKEGNEVAFSLDEALNPKESLAEICRSLGLNTTL